MADKVNESIKEIISKRDAPNIQEEIVQILSEFDVFLDNVFEPPVSTPCVERGRLELTPLASENEVVTTPPKQESSVEADEEVDSVKSFEQARSFFASKATRDGEERKVLRGNNVKKEESPNDLVVPGKYKGNSGIILSEKSLNKTDLSCRQDSAREQFSGERGTSFEKIDSFKSDHVVQRDIDYPANGKLHEAAKPKLSLESEPHGPSKAVNFTNGTLDCSKYCVGNTKTVLNEETSVNKPEIRELEMSSEKNSAAFNLKIGNSGRSVVKEITPNRNREQTDKFFSREDEFEGVVVEKEGHSTVSKNTGVDQNKMVEKEVHFAQSGNTSTHALDEVKREEGKSPEMANKTEHKCDKKTFKKDKIERISTLQKLLCGASYANFSLDGEEHKKLSKPLQKLSKDQISNPILTETTAKFVLSKPLDATSAELGGQCSSIKSQSTSSTTLSASPSSTSLSSKAEENKLNFGKNTELKTDGNKKSTIISINNSNVPSPLLKPKNKQFLMVDSNQINKFDNLLKEFNSSSMNSSKSTTKVTSIERSSKLSTKYSSDDRKDRKTVSQNTGECGTLLEDAQLQAMNQKSSKANLEINSLNSQHLVITDCKKREAPLETLVGSTINEDRKGKELRDIEEEDLASYLYNLLTSHSAKIAAGIMSVEHRGTKALELWTRRVTEGYAGVSVTNMTTSWRDGLAFCALIHHFRPDLIDFKSLKSANILENNALAFRVAEQHLGIPALLDAEDMVQTEIPDRLSILTYVSQFYQAFSALGLIGPGGRRSPVSPNTTVNNAKNSPVTSPTTTTTTNIPISKPTPIVPSPRSKPISQPPATLQTKTETGFKTDKVAAGARGRREECVACHKQVFLAERIVVGFPGQLRHRTCFRCDRCSGQLTLASYYETEKGQFCCETCPDEERNLSSGDDEATETGKLSTTTPSLDVEGESSSDSESDSDLTSNSDSDEHSSSFHNDQKSDPLTTPKQPSARTIFLHDTLDKTKQPSVPTPSPIAPPAKPPRSDAQMTRQENFSNSISPALYGGTKLPPSHNLTVASSGSIRSDDTKVEDIRPPEHVLDTGQIESKQNSFYVKTEPDPLENKAPDSKSIDNTGHEKSNTQIEFIGSSKYENVSERNLSAAKNKLSYVDKPENSSHLLNSAESPVLTKDEPSVSKSERSVHDVDSKVSEARKFFEHKSRESGEKTPNGVVPSKSEAQTENIVVTNESTIESIATKDNNVDTERVTNYSDIKDSKSTLLTHSVSKTPDITPVTTPVTTSQTSNTIILDKETKDTRVAHQNVESNLKLLEGNGPATPGEESRIPSVDSIVKVTEKDSGIINKRFTGSEAKELGPKVEAPKTEPSPLDSRSDLMSKAKEVDVKSVKESDKFSADIKSEGNGLPGKSSEKNNFSSGLTSPALDSKFASKESFNQYGTKEGKQTSSISRDFGKAEIRNDGEEPITKVNKGHGEKDIIVGTNADLFKQEVSPPSLRSSPLKPDLKDEVDSKTTEPSEDKQHPTEKDEYNAITKRHSPSPRTQTFNERYNLSIATTTPPTLPKKETLKPEVDKESKESSKSDYPDELNPFGSDEEEVKVSNQKPVAFEKVSNSDTRPLRDSQIKNSTEQQNEVADNSVKTTQEPVRKKLQTKPFNPFDSDDDDDDDNDDDGDEEEDQESKRSDQKKKSLNPFWSEDESDNDSCSSTPSKNKVKPPRPPPPTLNRNAVPTPKKYILPSSVYDQKMKKDIGPPPSPSPSAKSSSSDQSTLRLKKKNRQAPAPPPVGSSLQITPDLNQKGISEADDALSEKMQKELKNHTSKLRDANQRAEGLSSCYRGGITTPKSEVGEWRRKKGPAPSRPVPQKRAIRKLPMRQVAQELQDIEVKQTELERQGVLLETAIRERTEGALSPKPAPSRSTSPDDSNTASLNSPSSNNSEAEKSYSSITSTTSSLYPPIEVEDMILQLFELVNEKNELFRRQTELMYLKREKRLEEEHAELEYQIRCLMLKPPSERNADDEKMEEDLIARLLKVVEQRDAVVNCLEMERQREAMEDESIANQMIKYQEKHIDGIESDDSKEQAKKKKKKLRLIKKKKKGKDKEKTHKIDADKDVDETEIKKKKKKKWFKKAIIQENKL